MFSHYLFKIGFLSLSIGAWYCVLSPEINVAAATPTETTNSNSQDFFLSTDSSFYLAQEGEALPSDDGRLDQIDPEDLLPEIEPEDVAPPEEDPQEEVPGIEREFILDIFSESGDRYPHIINPFDRRTNQEDVFSPDEKETYFDFDLRFAEDNPIFKQFSVGHFPEDDQFYWVMDGNRVVFESEGLQAGTVYQGRTREIEIIERFLLRQGFFGVQAIWGIPGDLSLVEGDPEDLEDFQVFAAAGEVENPEGFSLTGNLEIEGLDLGDETERDSLLKLGTGSSRKLEGGGSLFADVKPENAPRIVQAFPTVDLSPLIEGGDVPLESGAILSEEALEETGIRFASPLNDEEADFDFDFSSQPGVKIGQRDEFDNLDLLSVLVNPFLSERERNESYLNSLFWAWLGQKDTEVAVESNIDTRDWHRLYASYAHNRSLLEYDSEDIATTYTSLFVNPGLSLSLSFEEGEGNGTQAANSSIGMLLGVPLAGFSNLNNLQGSLDEAKEEYDEGKDLTPLNTQATSNQRRQMNQRLNQTLRYGELTSDLYQLSGAVTFPSQITPDHSNVLQLRTGLHRRSVEFEEALRTETNEGPPVLTNTRLSQDDFNLNFTGVPVGNPEGNTPSGDNVASAAEIALVTPDGQQFLEQVSSDEAPLPTKGFTLAFDRLEISRIDRRETRFNQFLGYLDLPSVELLWAGSSDDFNYSLSAGGWFNVNRDVAPGVENNERGLEEPSVGAYANSTLNWTLTNLRQNDQGNPIGIDAHIPALRVSWNSEINRRNPFSAVLSYAYVQQRPDYSLTISPLIAYIPNGTEEDITADTDFIGLLQGQLALNSGFELETVLEVQDEFFYDLEALQALDSDQGDELEWSVGGFISNYTRTLTGLPGRRSEFKIGPVIRASQNDASLEARLGIGGDEPDFRFEGNISF